MKRMRTDAVPAGLAVCLLAGLILLRAALNPGQHSVPSTYDTGPQGYAALYEFLSREHVDVRRFEEPAAQLFSYRGTLVMAGPDDRIPFTDVGPGRRTLETWVRSGGTLVLLGGMPRALRKQFSLSGQMPLNARAAQSGCGIAAHFILKAPFAFGMPAGCTRETTTLASVARTGVVVAYRHGSGMLIYGATAQLFDNAHLARADNAAFAYAVLARSPVSFDEYVFGYSRSRTFWQVLPNSLRIAVVIAALALTTAIAGAALPAAPPKPVSSSAERGSAEYIHSLAAMLQRGGARRATVRRLARAAEERLTLHGAGPQRASLLEQARALQALAAPGQADLLAAGRLFASVRKDEL